MRERLGQKINEVLEMKLRDIDPKIYEEHQAILNRETTLKSYLVRLASLRHNCGESLEKRYNAISVFDIKKAAKLVIPFIEWYEEVTQTSSGITEIRASTFSIDDLAARIKGVEIEIKDEFTELARRRAAILEPLFHKYSNPQQ
ncbi:hypothetical protein A3G06_00170 [Candidatus Nomurabacteria bacterium RIFCSPLOWO2_12_FULL_46_14]|uniref:Uncharacterized protein n=1 Tax=Candidatus Nomurabacteria bacterium RIFCSPLOWO2_12_FULL_46_14 TaxID=1801797 RepID=A0A1F6Y8Q1_9BACT|nr:MAG: hypothetical protein A3G06_00170 [Candidatus Nomurabacteria bacterium RIFCSPLOWO2_12_FULL_46_14]